MRIRTYPLPDDHYVLVIDRAGELPETVQEFVSTAKANAGPKCAAVLVHADDVDLCDGSEALEGMVSSAQSLASGYFAERPLADSPITFYSGVQACHPDPVAYVVARDGTHVSDGCSHPDPRSAEDCAAGMRRDGREPRIVPLYAGVGPATTSNEGSQDG